MPRSLLGTPQAGRQPGVQLTKVLRMRCCIRFPCPLPEFSRVRACSVPFAQSNKLDSFDFDTFESFVSAVRGVLEVFVGIPCVTPVSSGASRKP
jgi:hypothetical protein